MSLLYTLDLIGTAAFAASGAWAGVRRKMDLFGVLVLGLVTAVGGGTLRDMLLGDLPPFCFKDENYLVIAFAFSLLIFCAHTRLAFFRSPLQLFDAIGLGTFVVIGTTKALSFNMGILGAIIMGTVTATAGGIMRDILANQIPLILRKEIYASACCVGGALLVFSHHMALLPPSIAALLSATTVTVIRLLAIRNNWVLPRARQ